MRTLSSLLESFHIQRNNTKIPQRPDMVVTDTWAKGAHHWLVVLDSHTNTPDGYLFPALGSVSVLYSQGSAHTAPPSARDVLESLISDASMRTQFRDVDEFAEEMGYTKPSRAFAIWEACAEADKKLKVLFGADFEPSEIDTNE